MDLRIVNLFVWAAQTESPRPPKRRTIRVPTQQSTTSRLVNAFINLINFVLILLTNTIIFTVLSTNFQKEGDTTFTNRFR